MPSFMNRLPSDRGSSPVPHHWLYEIAMSKALYVVLFVSAVVVALSFSELIAKLHEREVHEGIPLAWFGVSTFVITGIIVLLAHSTVGPIGAYRQNVDHAMKMRIIETYRVEPLATLSWKTMNGQTEFAVAPPGGDLRWVTATMPRSGGELTLRTSNGNELAKPSEGGSS